MFFGFGAYGVALALTRFGPPTWGHLAAGLAVAVVSAAVVASAIGAFSLRVKAIFFAMITLAFAEFALILAVQLTGLSGGEDGLSPKLPGALAVAGPGARLLGVTLSPRLVAYYLVTLACVGLFVLMIRFVDSPLGRTLQAIRDNALRAEALGLPTFRFQLVATAFASAVAALLGGGYALWVRYVNPESVLGIHVMLDVLLMVIIGGIGSLWGGIIGAAVLLTAQTLLPDLRLLGTALFASAPFVVRLTERWQLWVGVLFILAVFFFPRGVIGTLKAARKDARR
jgi:branched-chain amino acid transport system permease protein